MRSLQTVEAQQLSRLRSIGANGAVVLLGSGVFTRQQQQRLQSLSRQLLEGVPDSQSLQRTGEVLRRKAADLP